jgi:hypothetical protein
METTEQNYVPLVATPTKSGVVTILDEGSYTSLLSMLKSSNEEDWKMAQLVLNTCDIQKSIYWIWKLARYYCHRMVNLRTKASRYLREKADLFWISSQSGPKFVEHLEKKGWLTSEIYQIIEDETIERVKYQSQNKFYNVTIQVKDEYKHLVANSNLINFKKDE